MQRCGHARCPCCSHEEGDRRTFWFCCQCGDGPNSEWNPCCSGEPPLRSSKPHAQSTDGDQHEVVNGDTDRARYPPVEDDGRTEHGDGSQSTSIATRPSGRPHSETKALDPLDDRCSPGILGGQDWSKSTRSNPGHQLTHLLDTPEQLYDAAADRHADYEDNSDDDGQATSVHTRMLQFVEKVVVELEELVSDDAHDERLQIVKPDRVDDARSDHSELILEESRSSYSFKDLFVSEESSEEEERARFYQTKKLGWTEGMIPRRTRNRSVEGDSSYAGSDSEDKGFANTNNIGELKELEELSQQRRGPPSIPDDDAFTLDELPLRGGQDEEFLEETNPRNPWTAQMKAMLKASADVDMSGLSALSGYDDQTLQGIGLNANDVASTRVGQVGKDPPGSSADSEDDGRSIQSLESSTTLVTTLSGFTVVELEGATVELQGIFQKDADLVTLYRQGIKDASIGPERLQRNVVRLLRLFARDLRHEARQELEKMASRFVSTKARYIAQCIVEEYHDQAIEQEPHQLKAKQKETECDDKQRNEDQEELDDVDDLVPVDEDLFEDLPTLRTFLVNSAAFQVFREELTKFVLPKELRSPTIQSTKEGATTMAQPVDHWYYSKTVRLALKATLVAAGCLEPPLQAGMVRLRWQCVSPPD